MDDADRAHVRMLVERLAHLGGGHRMSELGPHPVHLHPVGCRNVRHAIAEKPVRGHQHLVAGAKHAGDARLDARHARAKDEMYVA